MILADTSLWVQHFRSTEFPRSLPSVAGPSRKVNSQRKAGGLNRPSFSRSLRNSALQGSRSASM